MGAPLASQWQPISLQNTPLLPHGGTNQLLFNVLQHYTDLDNRKCEPCTVHQQQKMDSGATVSKDAGTIKCTRQAVRLPVMLLVSVCSLQVRQCIAASRLLCTVSAVFGGMGLP